MVVLSKLATDFYKYLGFKNRTVGMNLSKYVLQGQVQATGNNIKLKKILSDS